MPTLNLAAATAFYRDVLGLRLIAEEPFANVFDANGIVLRVTPVQEHSPSPDSILSWRVPDIDRSAGKPQSRGVTLEHYGVPGQDESGIWTSPGNSRVCWFKDPDNNVLFLLVPKLYLRTRLHKKLCFARADRHVNESISIRNE